MLKKEFIDKMRNDEELQELRKKVFAITGKRKDIAFCAGKYTMEEWKNHLREIIRNNETTSQ